MNYAKDITADYTSSYAKYVALNRAIPSLVDGFKPVHRRCVNSALDLKLFHDRKFLKVSKLSGQVMGDYHPHGGASMTILAQPFKTRYPLFEGQGNWGSPDEPNSVAAERYIETRMTKFCEDFYISSADYADKEDNYDGRLKEIVKYYPPIPGVLLTSASGIAVGLSTNIPPHRVSDVCKSLKYYINNDIKYLDIYPETCEESIILTPKEEIKKLYTTGECSIQYKAKTHYETVEGCLSLVVDAFPPDYSKKRLETTEILEAVEEGRLDLRNESSTHIRYVFISKNNDKSLLESIESRLVSSSGYRMYIEHDGKIHLYRLNEIYDAFIEARKSYIIRKYTDIVKKNELEIEYIRVLMALKKDKDYLKSMFDKSHKEVVKEIMDRYQTNQETASRVTASSLSSMMKDNIEKLSQKLDDLNTQSAEYQNYIINPIEKIKLDIDALYKVYKSEERRAIHIDDVRDEIRFDYNGTTIEAHPSDTYYVASHDNVYDIKHAAELANSDLSDLIIVPTTYKYYVMYDSKGLIAITSELMSKMSNKFNSKELVGIIGTNDLTRVVMKRSNSNRLLRLNEGYLRTRLSYIWQVPDGEFIEMAEN